MKYQEDYIGSKSELAGFFKKVVPQLFSDSNRMVVEGEEVIIPYDRDLDYKVKYSKDEEGGSVAIKISWDNAVEDEEEEEEEDSDD